MCGKDLAIDKRQADPYTYQANVVEDPWRSPTNHLPIAEIVVQI